MGTDNNQKPIMTKNKSDLQQKTKVNYHKKQKYSLANSGISRNFAAVN